MDRYETVRNGSSGGPELSPRQERAAALIAGGLTLAAARKAKVGTTTLNRWAKEPAFRDRVKELRQQLTDRTLGLLASASADAVTTLAALLAAKADGTKLRAADSLLTHTAKARELDAADLLDEVLARLNAIEVRRAKR